MANLNLSVISKRLDRLSGPAIDPEPIVVEFVSPGVVPPPITQATCREVHYRREADESEAAFLDRIAHENPPTRHGATVILLQPCT